MKALRVWWWTALCAVLLWAGSATGRVDAQSRAAAPAETRALWVLRSSLTSPASISTLVHTASQQGFNTLLVQVRGRGDAYYASALEPRAADLSHQPASFDPLATVLTDAHQAGLRVHAWVCVDLVSSAVELPTAPDHVVYRHPEWLMVPRPIAQEVAKLDPKNPAYVGKIARWTRGELDVVEGLYASPIVPESAAYTRQVIEDLATRYDLDGVHLDYARYPNQKFDYSRFAIAEFRSDMQPRLTPAARLELDALETTDLFAYPDRFPAEWASFRRDRLTALVADIRRTVHAVRPNAMFTSAVAPDPQDAFDERLQDWRGWVVNHLVDAVAPMAYTQEPGRFAEQIAAARDAAAAGGAAVWAGIGAYRLTPAQTIDDIQVARRLGASGVVLFSYDSLTGPKPPAPDYLATVGKAAFAVSSATPQLPTPK
jgi:uncharacterized lipoprotein YddW (UPF0748 family)